MTLRRMTFDETVAQYGDPRPYVHSDGTVDPEWERRIVSYATLPAPLLLSWDHSRSVTRFKCHRLLVQFFQDAFRKVYVDPEAWATLGDFGGCYAFRANRKNPRALSMHSWAAAVDVDVADNGQGHKPEMHPAVVAAFESEGFIWGGRFHGDAVDGMHFERGAT